LIRRVTRLSGNNINEIIPFLFQKKGFFIYILNIFFNF